MPKGNGRYHYMIHVLSGLKQHGGQATSQRIYAWLQENGLADESDLLTVQRDGGTRFRKEVRWARKELFDAGLMSAPASGVWELTSLGRESELTVDEARTLVRTRSRLRRESKGQSPENAAAISSAKPPELPTRGPTPSDWSAEVTRTIAGPAHTYLAQFGARDIWKVGYAQCVITRLRELNRHVPHEVLGEQWGLQRSQGWPNAMLAYRMEQAVLGALEMKRSTGERIICDRSEVEFAWDRLVTELTGGDLAGGSSAPEPKLQQSLRAKVV